MRIVIAPQGFKGTLTGPEAAVAMAEGARRALPGADVVLCPVADGGHGTLDALVSATGGRRFRVRVTGPIGSPVEAEWGVLGGPDAAGDGGTAVVEMALASGLTLVPEAVRDPMRATTYGTGQLIATALDAGYQRVIVGVGGSATNDGGAGAAQALGVGLLDALGHQVPHGAEALLTLEHIDPSHRHPALAEASIEVAYDVTNPLLGRDGAAMTYATQKGATAEQIPVLEEVLTHYAAVIQRECGVDVSQLPGGGAAGGLAAGLVALAGAKLVPGAALVCDALGLDQRLERAALVITGEGRVDWQTVFDKAPIEVARRAAKRRIPVIAVAGSFGRDAERVLQHGVTMLESAEVPGKPAPSTSADAAAALTAATERAVRRAVAQGLVQV